MSGRREGGGVTRLRDKNHAAVRVKDQLLLLILIVARIKPAIS